MLKSTEIKKYTIEALKQADFKQIQLIAKKPNGKPFHIDYIRKVCKGKRYNYTIQKTANLYLQKLKAFEDSINK